MRAFEYVRATEVGEAVRLVAAHPAGAYVAGGTTQLDLMKDGVLGPELLVDITRLPLSGVERRGEALHVGALTTMEELAADPTGKRVRSLPITVDALL